MMVQIMFQMKAGMSVQMMFEMKDPKMVPMTAQMKAWMMALMMDLMMGSWSWNFHGALGQIKGGICCRTPKLAFQ